MYLGPGVFTHSNDNNTNIQNVDVNVDAKKNKRVSSSPQTQKTPLNTLALPNPGSLGWVGGHIHYGVFVPPFPFPLSRKVCSKPPLPPPHTPPATKPTNLKARQASKAARVMVL